MKAITMKLFFDNKLVGFIRLCPISVISKYTHIRSRIEFKTAKAKHWKSWEHEDWWEFPSWNRIEIIDAN